MLVSRSAARITVSALTGLALAVTVAPPAQAAPPTGVSCGDEVTGKAVVRRDLTCDAAGTIVVSGAGATLDLAGHTVRASESGQLSTGILVSGSGARVLNGRVEGFGTGVSVEAPSTISRLKFAANNVGALYLAGPSRVERSTFTDNDYGVVVDTEAADPGNSAVVTVRHSTFLRNRVGLFSARDGGKVNIALEDSTVSGGDTGFSCFQAVTTVTRSRITDNRTGGRLLQCERSVVERSTFARNDAPLEVSEFFWEPSEGFFTLRRTTFERNAAPVRFTNVRFASVTDNTFRRNAAGLEISDEFGSGPDTTAFTGGVISGNRFEFNAGDGLRAGRTDATLSGNTAVSNGGVGLAVDAAVDGGRNVARRNAAGQCVGISCR